MQQIADKLNCSVHKVRYWMEKHDIQRRTMSDAIYTWHNPQGDPFKFNLPRNKEEYILYGMGIGLYWGEGTKSNKSAIRLGNTDPELIKVFIDFLVKIFSIKKTDLHFGLQIFTDINPKEALDFWTRQLKVKDTQFWKPIVTISGSIGTYKQKSKYGVVTVNYQNIKARELLARIMPT